MDQDRARRATTELLLAIGEDPQREGLKDTPGRVARFWSEFIDYIPGSLGTAFTAETTDQMVVVSGMRVWSLCEHHLIPFWADISIAYIPDGKVLGLSKFARVAHRAAHKLQLQERLVSQIADDLERLTGTRNVAVVAKGEHLCMTMRGIKTPAIVTTSVMRGVFMDKPEARAEFLRLVHHAND